MQRYLKDDQEIALFKELQADLPIDSRPYQVIADKLGVTEDYVLGKLQKWSADGLVRRLGASLRHRQVGFKANAMIGWQVAEEQILEVGKIMATFPQASHVYQRPTYPDWPYNLFTMVHGHSKEECFKLAQEMEAKTGVNKYVLLFSVAELKKESMKYF